MTERKIEQEMREEERNIRAQGGEESRKIGRMNEIRRLKGREEGGKESNEDQRK